MLDDAGNVKEKRSLRIAAETVRAIQRIFLRDACDGEGLTRKPRQKYVMLRNFCGPDLGDVATYRMIARKICEIGFLRILVPLACEDAAPAQRLETPAQ